MIRIEDIRRRAEEALPSAVFQPYGDSPTVKSYTDWSAFESAMRLPVSAGSVLGASPADVAPSLSFDPSSNRVLAFHFSHIPKFYTVSSDDVRFLSVPGSFSLQHAVLCASEDKSVIVLDDARIGPKTLTLDVMVRPGRTVRVQLLVVGGHPQYVHVRYNLGAGSSVRVESVVIGNNAHVHHEVFLNGKRSSFKYSGVSLGQRSDVVTDVILRSASTTARASHALFSAPNAFLVHRGVARVETTAHGADVDMDSAFLTTGGFTASVPMLEVLTGDVVRASHRSRDLTPSEEAMFYLATRGLSRVDSMEIYVEEIVKSLAPGLASREEVRNAVRSFSESLPR